MGAPAFCGPTCSSTAKLRPGARQAVDVLLSEGLDGPEVDIGEPVQLAKAPARTKTVHEAHRPRSQPRRPEPDPRRALALTAPWPSGWLPDQDRPLVAFAALPARGGVAHRTAPHPSQQNRP